MRSLHSNQQRKLYAAPDKKEVNGGTVKVTHCDMNGVKDLLLEEIVLEEGARLGFYCEDADDSGRPDELLFEGTVHFDPEMRQWYSIIDESSYRHASNLRDPAKG